MGVLKPIEILIKVDLFNLTFACGGNVISSLMGRS